MKNIILASQSPRRKDILEKFQVKFQIIPSTIEEEYDIFDDPLEVVTKLALDKARDVAKKVTSKDLILAADTIVYYESILGKPKSRLDAFNTIKRLSYSGQLYETFGLTTDRFFTYILNVQYV